MPDRVFALPVATQEDPGSGGKGSRTRRVPKYSDTEGIDGFSGITMFFDESEHYDVPWAGQEMYLVRMYGDAQALQAVEDHEDAYRVGGQTIPRPKFAEYLSQLHGREQSYHEWIAEYTISSASLRDTGGDGGGGGGNPNQ